MQAIAAKISAFLTASAADLFWPGALFLGVALMAGGAAAFVKARAAAGEVSTNLKLYVFDALLIAPALAALMGVVATWIEHHNASLLHPADWTRVPGALALLAALFVGDFIGYWRHRLEHTPLLWPAHAIHHSDTAMTWTTLARFHPINRLTTVVIDGATLALFGFPPWAVVANALVRHWYGMFIHVDVPWTYGPLGRVLVSPAMHRWHHVREGKGVGANFATVFSVFDQAFGTHHSPGPCTEPLGVPDAIGRGALGQLAWPFQAAWRALAPYVSLKARAARRA